MYVHEHAAMLSQ